MKHLFGRVYGKLLFGFIPIVGVKLYSKPLVVLGNVVLVGVALAIIYTVI